MKKLFFAVAITTAATTTIAAGGTDGVWRTETSDSGGYLEVTIGPCDSDSSKTCGVISKAYGKQGLDPGYKNLGKLIVEDMKLHGEDSYSGGTIWDPEKDKTYKSKMHLKGDVLDVEGCIAFICSGEDWARVK